MKDVKKLSVPEQVIVYLHFSPPDVVAKKIFDIDDTQLLLIKNLAKERFSPTTVTINPQQYSSLFKEESKDFEPPRTATRQKRPRGRPGLNIIKAFSLIPKTPVPAEAFASQNNISLSVLRQHKRFDKTNIEGQVYVRKDSKTDQLMVWRA